MAMTYGTIYVASVAMGAKDEHTLKAFLEAEAYDGPALIIAYSHCIAHGINMSTADAKSKSGGELGAMASVSLQPGPRPLGENPLQLDSAPPRSQSRITSRWRIASGCWTKRIPKPRKS